MNHPQSCTDPNCTLTSYAAHLRGIQISPRAIPSRAVNRSPRQPDEPITATWERETRWDRENEAMTTLARAGVECSSFKDAPRMVEELGG